MFDDACTKENVPQQSCHIIDVLPWRIWSFDTVLVGTVHVFKRLCTPTVICNLRLKL